MHVLEKRIKRIIKIYFYEIIRQQSCSSVTSIKCFKTISLHSEAITRSHKGCEFNLVLLL